LAVPLEWDQLENAERLSACGAGIRISRAKCTAASVGAAIQALLHTPQYRENARRIQQSFARLDKANAAIDRLESIAAARGASA
jgi:UDP:flavonoid glycosyltransferase YjiC (YdhE family)